MSYQHKTKRNQSVGHLCTIPFNQLSRLKCIILFSFQLYLLYDRTSQLQQLVESKHKNFATNFHMNIRYLESVQKCLSK